MTMASFKAVGNLLSSKLRFEKTCQTFRDFRSAKFKKGSWNVVEPSGFVYMTQTNYSIPFHFKHFVRVASALINIFLVRCCQ